MYKAQNSISGEEILILQPGWLRRIVYLRQMDQENRLVCPGCLQPVRVRAGKVKRWHFAHKHLQNCPFELASPALLEARAVLYEWLVGCFPAEAITVEKVLETAPMTGSPAEARLPRPIDCWVEKAGGGTAYWVIENRLAPQAREQLRAGFSPLQGRVHWVFLASMLKQDELGAVILTTTEREFKVISPVDIALAGSHQPAGGSLHYLDVNRSLLTTYRSLRLVHSPQLHAGLKQSSPLRQVSAHSNTGDFLHPGEMEVLDHYLAEEQKRTRTVQEAREIFARGLSEPKRRELAGFNLPQRFPRAGETAPPDDSNQTAGEKRESPFSRAGDSPAQYRPDVLLNEEGICVHCREKTRDWWWINRRTKECKCRTCYRKGLG